MSIDIILHDYIPLDSLIHKIHVSEKVTNSTFRRLEVNSASVIESLWLADNSAFAYGVTHGM